MSQHDDDNGETALTHAEYGNNEAFGRLVRSKWELTLHMARRYLRQYPLLRSIYDAEDATVEAFVTLWKKARDGKLARIDGQDDLDHALRRSLSRHIRAMYKHESADKRTAQHSPRFAPSDASACESARPLASIMELDLVDNRNPEAAAPDAWLAAIEQAGRLRALLDETEREVVDLRIDGLTIGKIASRLGLKEAAVRGALKRIRRVLRSSGLLE